MRLIDILRLLRDHHSVAMCPAGLCSSLRHLYISREISKEEFTETKTYLYKRVKENTWWTRFWYGKEHPLLKDKGSVSYFWVPYYRVPRIRFLDYLIKQLEDKKKL